MTLAKTVALEAMKHFWDLPGDSKIGAVLFGPEIMQLASSTAEALDLVADGFVVDDYTLWDIDDLIQELEEESA